MLKFDIVKMVAHLVSVCSSSSCKWIKVRTSQSSISGLYYQLPDFLNDKPAFQQLDGSYYLYFLSLQIQFWIFSLKLGGVGGSVMSATQPYVPPDHPVADHPAQADSWIVNVGNPQWVIDSGIRVQCVCQSKYLFTPDFV